MNHSILHAIGIHQVIPLSVCHSFLFLFFETRAIPRGKQSIFLKQIVFWSMMYLLIYQLKAYVLSVIFPINFENYEFMKVLLFLSILTH
jgi:hypothetical protein